MDNLSRVERHSHGNVLVPEAPCARVTPQGVWQTVGGDPPLVELVHMQHVPIEELVRFTMLGSLIALSQQLNWLLDKNVGRSAIGV